ncbi:sensor histidine kinase [Aquimarina sp. MAR_2010_214]|uniref:sensor histidine kinase n=1 Tax=Aquimarina sp. MAR_2010_214 TaxID=1250026 RepID=UPI001E547D95|nr:histidine kinase [Aquimarina sp. MAR_2010_214]
MSKSILAVMIAVYIIVALVSAFSLVKHNYKSNSTNQELQHKILEAQLKLKEQELHYLKMQIHPHFLFNTLNTMYGFALKKSEETPEMILKLSNLLDYLLYQVDKPLVPLKQELDHIKDYISLEKMRFSNTLDIITNFEDVNNSIQIAPMLLIPFVENSFKHGQIRNKKMSIHMKLTHINSVVHFSIKNSIYSSSKNDQDGIGLSNIKKRLSSLYNDNHELLISKNEQWHNVELKLNTSKPKSQ